jgi:uncharacterized iron-regulated protein
MKQRYAPVLVAMAVLALVVSAPAHADIPDSALASADVVILGEIHDDPAHHRIQAETIARMVALGRAPTVVFEMIPADLQAPLGAALADPSISADRLGEVLAWEERGWGDFALYRPIFTVALESRLQLRAGDLTDDDKRQISRGGAAALSAEEQTRLGLDVPLGEDARAALRETLVTSHCGMLPEKSLPAMIDVQRARDGAMADAVKSASEQGPVVLITGQGHARRDWGVPAVLARTAPDLKVFSIALVADGAGASGPFDAIIATGPPPKRDEDPCAAFK